MARIRVSRRDVLLSAPRRNDVPQRLPFPCYFLCDRCGWLEDGPVEHPMRRDERFRAPGPCPSCEATQWIDLGHESMAYAYREAEGVGRTLAARRARRRALWDGAGMSLVATAASVVAFPELVGLAPTHTESWVVGWVAVWVMLIALVMAVADRRHQHRARPRRWRGTRPHPELTEAVRAPVEGVVEGEGVLQTPLSREPCVAWSVRVWSGRELLLDEQHHAPLTVGGVRVPADSIRLDLAPREPLHPRADDEAFVRFMARRGLSIHEDSLRIEASHLVSGVPVALRRARGRAPTELVLSQAPRALAS